MALTQLHSIYHIDKYRYTICAIFLVIMLDTMCITAYILAAMAGSIFAATCICAIASTSCILSGALHLHHEYAWHIYRSSFYLFLGAAMWVHLVCTATFVPHITPVHTICTAAPCQILLVYITTSGGMFFMAWSSSRLYHLNPCVRTSQLLNRA